mmetsp:Transcript_14174/g.33799  ORF Transcript_14174/g.33799 Transcript_14174/m.33799 type:complete len:684 (+) Transcript_14174:57-2108(+)
MVRTIAKAAFSLLGGFAAAQQAGTTGDNIEKSPPLALSHCTKASGCTIQQANLTLDANWRWVYKVNCPGNGQPCYSAGNCFNAGQWDKTVCEDPEACAQNCAVAGVNAAKYQDTYGVVPIPGGVELKFVTGQNIGSRLYLSMGETYKMFRLKNREFTFDVDVSALPCGLNGAVYFVQMPEDGGKSGDNKAGALYGTGYCDAQCPHDVKFMNGKANVLDWDQQNPFGRMGACCTEMDLWEANSAATAYTPHPCRMDGPLICDGKPCGDADKDERYEGVCDKDGCDYNSYRMGEHSFFGAGPDFTIDTTKKITVVTQFITADGTDTGDLSEIRRIYVQDGKSMQNSVASLLGSSAGNSITDAYCKAQKEMFGDTDDFTAKGGLKQMGKALDQGMVLVMSLWDDDRTSMLWLDSQMGEGDASSPGVARGPCSDSSGLPQDVRSKHGTASVKYSNFMYGEIGSTFTAPPADMPEAAAKVDPYASRLTEYAKAAPPQQASPSLQAPVSVTSPSTWQPSMGLTPSSVCAKEFELCGGGQEWSGPRCCNDGCTCKPKFWSVSQCKPDAGRTSCPAPAPEPSFQAPPLAAARGTAGASWGSSVGGWMYFLLAIQSASLCVFGPYLWQRYMNSKDGFGAPGSPLATLGTPIRRREREVTSPPTVPRPYLDFSNLARFGRSTSTVSVCKPDEV